MGCFINFNSGGGAGGSGTPNTLPLWVAPTTLGDSFLSQSGANVHFAPTANAVLTLGNSVFFDGAGTGFPRVRSIASGTFLGFELSSGTFFFLALDAGGLMDIRIGGGNEITFRGNVLYPKSGNADVALSSPSGNGWKQLRLGGNAGTDVPLALISHPAQSVNLLSWFDTGASLYGAIDPSGNLYLNNTTFLGRTSSANPPSATEYPNPNDWGFHEDTGGGAVYLAFNYSGSIVSVQLT